MTATTVDINLPPLAQYQIDAIFAPPRHGYTEASTKSGKTYGNMLWIFAEAAKSTRARANFWWIAPIYPQAEIAYQRLKLEVLTPCDPQQARWKPNDSKLTITLANGSVISFKSADKPDGLYGEDVYAAVIDEASRVKEAAWFAVRSTVTATRGRLRVIGNVKGRKNWAYRLGQRAKNNTTGDWTFASITAADAVAAGILSQSDVDEAERDLPPHVFRELYFNEPSDDGGNPFGLGAIARCVKDGFSPNPAVAYGVDLAKSVDWTVVIGVDMGGWVVSIDRWQGPWADTKRKIVQIVGGVPVAIDSTGVGDPIVEDLKLILPCVEAYPFTSKSKQQLMQGLAAAIQSNTTAFPDGVLRDELDSFEYEYKGTDGRFDGVRYSAPVGCHDDCVCALALAMHSLVTRVPFSLSVVGKPAIAPPPIVAAQSTDYLASLTASIASLGTRDLSGLGESWRSR